MGFLSFLKNLFQRSPHPRDLKSSAVKTDHDELIEFVNENGAPIFVTREVYRTQILPQLFTDASGEANALYQQIIQAIEDGFFNECLRPAYRLIEIDPIIERSHTVFGIVLLKNQRIEEAQTFYEKFTREKGEFPTILTNLAKVYAEQGQHDLVIPTLWKSLLLDPNIPNTVGWYVAIANEQGGHFAYLDALNRIAAIPGSWHAQLWIAQDNLKQGRLDLALAIYQEVLPRAKESTEALLMISGDLGSRGYAKEALELILPIFDITVHGYPPALNLLQACIQRRELAIGSQLLNQLKNLKRPELLTQIQHFEQALENA